MGPESVQTPQPQYTASFTISISAIRTRTIGSLDGVIKVVEFKVVGSEGGCEFELPQTVELGDPDQSSFIPLPQVDEQSVVSWVEGSFQNMHAVKSHIQFVLKRMLLQESLSTQPLPWQVSQQPVSQ
jgi:hypothetical protein